MNPNLYLCRLPNRSLLRWNMDTCIFTVEMTDARYESIQLIDIFLLCFIFINVFIIRPIISLIVSVFINIAQGTFLELISTQRYKLRRYLNINDKVLNLISND